MGKGSIDYFVTAHGVIERGMFYNYMHSLGYKDHNLDNRDDMINSMYPFAVDMKKKKLMIIESATMCYFARRDGKMKDVDEFKQILESK